jgi:hypothetical protein
MYASIALLALTACGNKEAPPEAGGEPTAAIKSNIPGDDMSQAYAEKLMDLTLRNFKPSDALGGAVLTYTSMTFRPDGSWYAAGSVAIGEDAMECEEQGTWLMEAASSQTTATMTWGIETTDCAGRKVGEEQRVQMSILDNGQYKVLFR